MSIGLVGRKVGMTRIFTENGASVPVTVLEMSNNRVTQVRTPENDGYAAVQLAYGSRRNSRVNKSEAGRLFGKSRSHRLSFPPSLSAFSTIETATPISESFAEASMPATPPPITTTCFIFLIRSF